MECLKVLAPTSRKKTMTRKRMRVSLVKVKRAHFFFREGSNANCRIALPCVFFFPVLQSLLEEGTSLPRLMKAKCPKCGTEQELVPKPQRQLLHALPELRSPLEVVDPFACATCGSEIRLSYRFLPTDKLIALTGAAQGEPAAESRHGHVWSIDGQSAMSLNYPAVSVPGGNVLFPVNEGRLSAGRSIDRYGNPDLMAEFSAEYLKQYRAIVPKGRLPRSMTEMMPALHLLVNAAELALKADLIRSGKRCGAHVLRKLYGELEDEHRDQVERRFAEAGPNANLNVLGADRPSVEGVLRVYEQSFGGSSVYMDTRHLAEPTTMLKSESLKGGNVVKDIPYPVFLQVVVQAMLDVYAYFSGAERLERLGADVECGTRDPGNDQHGDWGLVPASLGLVVLRVAQQVAWDKNYAERAIFRRFKATHPPGYTTAWMYGGQSLLFYRADKEHPEDGETVIDGLECKVWYAGRLGMHARDLYQLADALGAQDDFPLLTWTN